MLEVAHWRGGARADGLYEAYPFQSQICEERTPIQNMVAY
jgi:hypothetical protein